MQSPTMSRPLTAEGAIVGTFQYMSPEQLEGREADERSDIWALGCVLYESVSGRRAFEGRSQASLIAAILEHEPMPIAEIQPLAPPALDRLLRSCLAKDPDDRLQSAHDVKLQIGWARGDASGPVLDAAATAPSVARGTRRTLAWVAAVFAVAIIAFAAGRRSVVPAGRSVGQYQQKTFRTQAIFTARFMPDGKTIVLSAAPNGNRTELFVIRPEYPEPQPLGKKDVHLLAVSSRGELAVLTRARFTAHHRLFNGTLARMPLEGAAPRELMEDVREADWSPDGENLAIIHDVGGSDRLEFPPGKSLYESSGYLSDVRVSPRGDLIAFMEHPARFDDRGSVRVVDLSGKVREIAGGYWGEEGMAWSPDGKALYYSGGKSGGLFSVYRATLDGDVRLVSDNAGVMTIHDIAPDGTWVVTRDDIPSDILFRAAGSDTDVDLSWLDSALEPVLSPDGKMLFFTDQSVAAGPNYAVAMRPTTGGPIVRLGEGLAQQVSSDAKAVLVIVPSAPPRLMKYPVGTGQAIRLDHGEFQNLSHAGWLPDETRVLVSGNLAGQSPRCFLLDPIGGRPTPVGSEGTLSCIPSPDGKTFIALTKAGWAVFLLSGGGDARPVAGMTNEDSMIRWNLDGSAVFVYRRNEIPAPVERVDVATGKRETVMMLSDQNRVGRVSVLSASIADDLRSIAYVTWNYSSVLFTVTTGP